MVIRKAYAQIHMHERQAATFCVARAGAGRFLGRVLVELVYKLTRKVSLFGKSLADAA